MENHHISLKNGRPRCHAKSSTTQDVFGPIPSFISWAGVTRRWAISCTKCSQSLAGKPASCLYGLTSLSEKGSWSLENAKPKVFCATVIWSSLDSPLIVSETMSNCVGETWTSRWLPSCFTSQPNSYSTFAQEWSIVRIMIYGSFCSSKFSPDEVDDHIIRNVAKKKRKVKYEKSHWKLYTQVKFIRGRKFDLPRSLSTFPLYIHCPVGQGSWDGACRPVQCSTGTFLQPGEETHMLRFIHISCPVGQSSLSMCTKPVPLSPAVHPPDTWLLHGRECDGSTAA